MKTFARVQDGIVAELVTTGHAIETLFHPDLVWLDVSGEPAVATGWRCDGRTVSRPPAEAAAAAPAPDPAAELADIRAGVEALQFRLTELERR